MDPVSRYKYDALYRLTEATGRELSNLSIPTHKDFENDIPCPDTDANAMRNYTQKFAYDAIGNMQYVKNEGQWTRNYHYMDNNYLLNHDSHSQEEVYKYDSHGNMIEITDLYSMNWDCKGQLISAGNETFISYYHYDMEGNRTRKTIVKGNIIEEYYYICGLELYRKYNNFNFETERKEISVSDDEKVFLRMQTRTTNGQATTVSRYQYDNHLGSACLELDDIGQVISYEEYYPFGSTSYRSGRNETEVSLKRYKYCGKEKDEETGLYYYGMRYYADWLCRFVSVDPLQFKHPELTPFQYASNNPVTMIDLDGAEGVKPEKKDVKTVTGAGYGMRKKGGIIDPGAIDDKNYEKDYALKIEEKIDIWLTEFGVDNMRTRECDLTVEENTINYRWKFANGNNAEVFVSIHLDWSRGIDNLVAIYESNQINSPESKKLAELIISNSKTLIPAQKSIKKSDETAVKTIAVLREFKGKAGVLLELGSIGSEITRDLINTKASEIGKEIVIGIYEYLFNTIPPTKAERREGMFDIIYSKKSIKRI